MQTGDRLGDIAEIGQGAEPEQVIHVLWTLVDEDLVVRVPGGMFYAGPLHPLHRFPRTAG